MKPEWLTVDHKPNTPAELKRIESCGGSLVWLHGVKPYIRYWQCCQTYHLSLNISCYILIYCRGGDFTSRQALGERPKQLNYSRAFGGKDLKSYGLIADPDVSHFEIADNDRLLILGSDGLWVIYSMHYSFVIFLLFPSMMQDVLTPTAAAEIAIEVLLFFCHINFFEGCIKLLI